MWNAVAFTFLLVHVYSVVCKKPNITFSPSHLSKIEENTVHVVNWTFGKNNTFSFKRVYFEISYVVLTPGVFTLSSTSPHYRTSCRKGNDTFSFKVMGKFLGYGKLEMILDAYECWTGKSMKIYSSRYRYEVSVVRGYSRAKDVFTGFLGVAIVIGYVNMGCQLDLGAIASVLRTPIGPLIGLCCQFVVMPLGSYLYGWILLDDLSLRLGLFTIGCSPGGSMSNFWSLLFNGDVNLSVTMTCISTIAAMGMMPFWFYTLGSMLLHKGKATIPYGRLATSLVTLTVPLALGIFIRRSKPKWAAISAKIIRPFTLMTVAITVFLGSYANTYIFILFTWKIVLSGFSVAASGYILGSLIAWMSCLKKAQILTIGIETAFQNGSIAYFVLILSFPQPEADLTAVPVVAQLLLTSLPMWIAFLLLNMWNCVKKFREHSRRVDCTKNDVASTNEAEGAPRVTESTPKSTTNKKARRKRIKQKKKPLVINIKPAAPTDVIG